MSISKLVASLLIIVPTIADAQTPAPSAAPSTIARLVITPSQREVQAGDTVRFSAQALDASGAVVRNARIRFNAIGGEGGNIDTAGVLIAGSTGVMPVSVVALVAGERPKIELMEIRLVPGPATRIDVAPNVQTLVVGQRVLMSARSYSNAGDERTKRDNIIWKSATPATLRVSTDGLVTAVAAGKGSIVATAGAKNTNVNVRVIPNSISALEVTPARQQARTGDVVRFAAAAKNASGKALGILSPTWTMSGGEGMIEQDGAFVAYQPGRYVVSAAIAGKSADAVISVEGRDVRRPVNIVGRLPRTQFTTAEVWIHPNGKVAYLGAHGGGDRFWAIDISNPAKPVVVDSVVMNTRLVNDVMTTADGKYLVATREGAADRKNGIVICSLEDPLHPKVISEFTDGVTAGVHSAYVFTQPKYGTHIYLTNDGNGAVHIIDINDPYHPKQVAMWTTPRAEEGRYLHDIDVRDGLLYGAWWNDGLVILDVGNGIKGGTPSHPVFVSQFKYDLNEMYKDVEIEGGAGHGRGTHTAWRHKNYVFIADEVYRASPVKGAKDAAADRMYGNLQVVDVSDIEHPRSVAWYKPDYGGVHNVWIAGDTLYMGAYDGGFQVWDISGELRGDLKAQGRQIAVVNTADMDGNVKNHAQTWGVVVNPKDGLAYVNDFNNGLWIIRIEPRPKVVP
ncbi:MAG: Ig-like domain-containing protein [Gemmatimonadaceae bacterium]